MMRKEFDGFQQFKRPMVSESVGEVNLGVDISTLIEKLENGELWAFFHHKIRRPKKTNSVRSGCNQRHPPKQIVVMIAVVANAYPWVMREHPDHIRQCVNTLIRPLLAHGCRIDFYGRDWDEILADPSAHPFWAVAGRSEVEPHACHPCAMATEQVRAARPGGRHA